MSQLLTKSLTTGLLCYTGLQEAPRSWLLIPPEQSLSRHVEVLVSVRDTVLSVDEMDMVDQVSLYAYCYHHCGKYG
jgi:hypothetical protein